MKLSNRIASSLFSVSPTEVKMSKRGFDCPDAKLAAHLETVGESFLHGYHDAIRESVTSYESEIPSMYYGFAYEGAAMGCAIRDLLPPVSKMKRTQYLMKQHEEHIYMIHVGVGWALARIPLVNIGRKLSLFDPIYRGLVVDGFGFHQAYFKTRQFVFQMKSPDGVPTSFHSSFYQGIGRALWFVLGAQPEKISQQIRKFPSKFHNDLWAGIGLAMAYAGGVGEDAIEKTKELSLNHRSEVAQGVSFACKARLRADNMCDHTELASQLICERSASESAEMTDKCLGDIDQNANKAYQNWRKAIILTFNKELSYEKMDQE